MPAVPIYIGLATDGPSNVAIRPQTEVELINLYGGKYGEKFTLAPTASSVSLSYEPWSTPQDILNGTKAQLFSPTVSGTTFFFGAIGGSGNQTLEVKYVPYLGKSDLIVAARKHFQVTGSLPYTVRIGGTIAKHEIPSEGWLFESKWPGAKYNNVSLSYTASSSSLTISGMEPEYKDRTYTWTGSPDDLKKQVNLDFSIGNSPVRIVRSSNTLSTFSSNLAGGTDGSFTSTSLQNILDSILPSRATHIALLTTASSALFDVLLTYQEDVNTQPYMFWIASPEYTSPASAWLDTMDVVLPERSNLVVAFIGDINIELDGREVTRYAVEGALAGFVRTNGLNITNTPIDAISFSPELSEEELNTVKTGGFMAVMRYIRNDISTYEGVTTAADSSFLFSSKLAEISAIARTVCMDYLGHLLPPGRKPNIERRLAEALSIVRFVTIERVQITVVRDLMVVEIDANLPGEVLTISFTIKNR